MAVEFHAVIFAFRDECDIEMTLEVLMRQIRMKEAFVDGHTHFYIFMNINNKAKQRLQIDVCVQGESYKRGEQKILNEHGEK